MRITPSRVHNKCSRVGTNGFGKFLGAFLDDDITPAGLAWQRSIQRRAVLRVITVLEYRNDNFVFETWFTLEKVEDVSPTTKQIYAYHLTFDRASIDGEVSEVGKNFLRTVLALYQFEEIRSIVDELCGSIQ